MYEEYFGLQEMPFALTPNTHYFLNSPSHQQALELLLVALRNQEGFIKISGEVGTGKTLLCRKLLNALEAPYVTAYIPNPQLTPEGLYMAFADELGLDLTTETHSHQLLKRINHTLIGLANEGHKVVLIIDEAQAMSEQTIEALRLLTNLETESARLVQVVLFGQPELDELLSRPSLRQLLQRITFQQRIAPLDREAVAHYVQHRLALAGYNGPALFQRASLSLLAKASKGIPRLINILAHKSLMAAYGEGGREISKAHVKRAIQDTESVRMPRFAWFSLGVLLLVTPLLSGIWPGVGA
ncbi:MAG: AAA family ATPase [Hahellaceae bacterium]|nr:AAA family ATPase [Hahellaceae bacterium]MCP5168580.1 AAA family ATPase [Hahellaceae bacterium]